MLADMETSIGIHKNAIGLRLIEYLTKEVIIDRDELDTQQMRDLEVRALGKWKVSIG